MSAHVLHVAEPPPRYMVRRPLVVDCSLLASAIFMEEATWEFAQQQLGSHELHAPYILQAEIVSVALKKKSAGSAISADDGLADAQDLGIHLHRIEEQPVLELATRFKLSAYDASYLWLAGFLKAPLATFDDKLAKAARTYLAGLP